MYLDVLIRKVIQIAGVPMLERRFFNFVSGVSATDNPATGATDLVVGGADSPLVDPVITGTVTFQGDGWRTLSIPGKVVVTSAGTAIVASYDIPEGVSCTFDFICAMKAVGTVAKAGRWDGKGTWRREVGGAATAVGSAEYGTPQETTSGDGAVFDLSTNTLRVQVTSADADDRTFTCELHVHETND